MQNELIVMVMKQNTIYHLEICCIQQKELDYMIKLTVEAMEGLKN